MLVRSTEARAFLAMTPVADMPCVEITAVTQHGERVRLVLDDDDAGRLIDQLLEATSNLEFYKEGVRLLPSLPTDFPPPAIMEGV